MSQARAQVTQDVKEVRSISTSEQRVLDQRRAMLPDSIVDPTVRPGRVAHLNGNPTVQASSKEIVENLLVASKIGPKEFARVANQHGVLTNRELMNAVWLAENGHLINNRVAAGRVDRVLTEMFKDPHAFEKLSRDREKNLFNPSLIVQVGNLKPEKAAVSGSIKSEAVVGSTNAQKTERHSPIVRSTSTGKAAPAQAASSTSAVTKLNRDDINADLSDPMALLTKAKFSEVEINGQKGLSIAKIKEGSLFKKLELVDGDILLSANGKPIENLLMAKELTTTLSKENDVKLEIIRAGEKRELNYVIGKD